VPMRLGVPAQQRFLDVYVLVSAIPVVLLITCGWVRRTPIYDGSLAGSWVLGCQASVVWLPVCAATGLAVWGRYRTQPKRRLGRLHRLLNDGEQLDGERVEVDLLAQPGRPMLPRCGRRRGGG
jgi:hypothetical protein